jgi:hypothetical protein
MSRVSMSSGVTWDEAGRAIGGRVNVTLVGCGRYRR